MDDNKTPGFLPRSTMERIRIWAGRQSTPGDNVRMEKTGVRGLITSGPFDSAGSYINHRLDKILSRVEMVPNHRSGRRHPAAATQRAIPVRGARALRRLPPDRLARRAAGVAAALSLNSASTLSSINRALQSRRHDVRLPCLDSPLTLTLRLGESLKSGLHHRV